MTPRTLLLAALLLAATAACNRADHLGRPPTMSEPQSTPEFTAMTTPELFLPETPQRPEADASLWAGEQSSLVRDRRAATRGDILTVVIEIDDKAEISNSLTTQLPTAPAPRITADNSSGMLTPCHSARWYPVLPGMVAV